MIELGRCKGTAHSIPWVVCTAVPERHSSPALEGRGLLAENGNRRLYLVSQFFATKLVEHLLGPAITADRLHDDSLGRTLDWLYDHDPTTLFAGIARQARQRFAVAARQVHVDTTSFAVSGAYNSAGERVQEPGKAAEAMEAETALIAITHGYSRDHREERTAVDVGSSYHP